MQAYQISFETFRAVLTAFQSAFPEVMAFISPGTVDILLVGSRHPLRPDLEELYRRWNVEETRTELARIGMHRPEHLLANYFIGPEAARKMVEGARLNTDNNMYVEFQAVRGISGTELQAFQSLGPYETPPEAALADPSALLGNRERLAALVQAMKEIERRSPRHDELLMSME